jgi:NADH-quinone oxidoreductase subunit L
VSGFSIRGISAWALSGDGSQSLLLWTAVALFVACIGKSGQFPLHTWLPDAMAGPTPVSSLLHSSTMVVAGVFLVARLYPVFWEGFSIPDVDTNLIVVIAAITIIISGLLGLVQDDIKKVLAYSTVGQLAYMMLGLGAGAWLPAVFHIFTHAFFKCCLFLCAGSVSHSGSHHSFDMKKDMGGLWRKMPITTGAWIVSSLALVGMFPFAGFMSKDEIIDNVGHNGYSTFMWIALIGAFITAAYTVRATYLTFFGEPRGAAAGVHHEVHTEEHAIAAHDVYQEPELQDVELGAAHAGPHESPKLLLVPICILAVLAFATGWTNAAMLPEEYHQFAEYVEPNVAHAEEEHAEGAAAEPAEAEAEPAEAEGEPAASQPATFPPVEHAEFHWWPNAATSLLIVGAGLVSAWAFCVAYYGRRDHRLVGLTQRVPPLRWAYTFVANKYYLDVLYENVIVHAIAHPIARLAYWFNQNVIDGIANGIAAIGKRIGAWTYRWVDQGVVDGAVNGSGILAEETGEALRPVQSGRVNQYGALLFGAAAVGAIVLVIINV